MKNEQILLPMLGMMLLTAVVWFVHVRAAYSGDAESAQACAGVHDTGQDCELLPEEVNYPAYNLKNLFELPVLFYALCLYFYVTATAASIGRIRSLAVPCVSHCAQRHSLHGEHRHGPFLDVLRGGIGFVVHAGSGRMGRLPGCAGLIAPVSEGAVAGFAGANAPYLVDCRNENLAVADLAGLGGVDDGFDDAFDQVVGDCDFNLGFGKKINNILGSAVEFGVAALAAEAFDLTDGHALDSDLTQCIAHVIKAKGFYNGGDELHKLDSPQRADDGAYANKEH